MSDVEKIFGLDTLSEISRSVGDVNEKEVADVLDALLPFLDESSKSGDLAQRAADVQRSADAQRGINPMMLLPLLLGGNSNGILGQVSQSTGVSNNNISSIIKVAAPLLLLYLMKGNGSQSQQQANPLGLLGSLMGAAQPQAAAQPQQSASLLGSLLGMDQPQQQVVQQTQPSGSLLGSLLGMDQPQQQVVQQPQPSGSLLGSLLGMDQPQQQVVQQTQPSGSLLGSLLGGGSGSNDLLGTFVNLLADNGRAMPTQQPRQKSAASQKNAAKIAEKRAASVGTKNTSGSKKVSTNSSAAKKAAAGSSAAAKREAAKKKK